MWSDKGTTGCPTETGHARDGTELVRYTATLIVSSRGGAMATPANERYNARILEWREVGF